MDFENVLNEVRAGRPILVYDFDDRERECDLTVASQSVTPEIIRMLRKQAGGLICTTVPYSRASAIGLPFMSDLIWDESWKYPVLSAMAPNDIPYDRSRSSFGITINHRQTYTGITDNDRSMTIRSLVDTLYQDKPPEDIARMMGERFRSPGHVQLLVSAERLLEERRGHTELCTAMMYMAGVCPSATICEMLGDDGGSMPRDAVSRFAEENGIPMVTGEEILSRWEAFKDGVGPGQGGDGPGAQT